MIAGLASQRVRIGDQVAAHAIGVDELNDRGFLGDIGIGRSHSVAGDIRLSVCHCTGRYGICRSLKMAS